MTTGSKQDAVPMHVHVQSHYSSHTSPVTPTCTIRQMLVPATSSIKTQVYIILIHSNTMYKILNSTT